MKKVYCLLGFLLIFLLMLSPSYALQLELKPSTQTVYVGDSVYVDLAISGLVSGSAPSLSTFQIKIGYDFSILDFASATFGDPTFGDQLDFSGFAFKYAIENPSGLVDLYEVSLDLPSDLDTDQLGSFTLATLHFETIALGLSTLTIFPIDLGDTSTPISSLDVDEVRGATINVVPEPTTSALLGIGLLGLVGLVKRYNLIRVKIV